MADEISQRKYVTAENGFCEGHFPGHPIVPAAAQAQWALDLAMVHCPNAASWEIRQLKLLRELTPDREVTITLTSAKQGWRAVVADADGPFAQMTLIAHD